LNEEQKERLNQAHTEIALGTAQVRDSSDEQLVRLPTGDGMALVFHHSAEEPARCALEIAEALRKHPRFRSGWHSQRAVSEVTDVSGRSNLAGAGINMAAAGDGFGRRRAHSSLQHVRTIWCNIGNGRRCSDLGECEVKHGVLVPLGTSTLSHWQSRSAGEVSPDCASSADALPVVKPKRMPGHEIVIALLLVAAVDRGCVLLS